MRRRRISAGILIASAAVAISGVFFAVVGGPAAVQALIDGEQGTMQFDASTAPTQTSLVEQGCGTKVSLHFYTPGTTEVNPAKLRPGNFGPKVTDEESAVVQDRTETVRCDNPYTTATHVAAQGWHSATPESITALGEHFKANPDHWRAALLRLSNWERDPNTKMSIEVIPKAYASYYMEKGKDAQSVVVKHDTSVQPNQGDKMAVYRNGNVTIMRALSCELQPIAVGMSRMPDKFAPTPERTPPGTSTPPGTGGCTYGPCSETTTTTPNCYEQGECKSTSTSDYPYPSGKPKVTETKPADSSPPPVETTRTTTKAPTITPSGPVGTTPVNPGSSTNNGSIPPTNSGPNCNPKFEPCPTN